MDTNPSHAFISVLRFCGLLGYEAEINHGIGLCRDARTDYNLLLTVSKVNTYRYRTKQKHRIQYAIRLPNYSWFKTIFDVSNRTEILTLRTRWNETFYHLLCGYLYVDDDTEEMNLEVNPGFRRLSGGGGNNNNVSQQLMDIFRLLVQTNLDMDEPISYHGKHFIEFYDSSYDGNTFLMLLCRLYKSSLKVSFLHELLPYAGLSRLDLNRKDTRQLTALLYALKNSEDSDTVQLLSRQPTIDTNIPDRNGRTPLEIAAQRRNVECFTTIFYTLKYSHSEYIHRVKGTLDEADIYPIFWYACQCNAVKIVQYFCTFPWFNMDIEDNNGNTGFMIAAGNGYLPLLDVFLNYYPERLHGINAQNKNYQTALFLACANNRYEIVQRLCGIAAINRNLSLSNHCTPLMAAAETGRLTILEELLHGSSTTTVSNEVDINHQDDYGQTALYLACRNNRLPIVHYLCSSMETTIDYDLGHINDEEDSPLIIAAARGYDLIVKELLRYGGDRIRVNRQTRKGETALFLACQNSHSTVVDLLCDVPGMDVQLANHEGITPFIIAEGGSNSIIIRNVLQNCLTKCTSSSQGWEEKDKEPTK